MAKAKRLIKWVSCFILLLMFFTSCNPVSERSKSVLGSNIVTTEPSGEQVSGKSDVQEPDSSSNKPGEGEKGKDPGKDTGESNVKTEIKLVSYTGKVEHLFIHPLLAYPEQAFDGDSRANGFDDWFITVGEFKKVLNSLYEKNFILVDINSLYEEVEKGGKKVMARRPIMVPEGKKPLILSIDDLNYYQYMIGNGTVQKLILDEKGNIATYTKLSDGKELISYDNEAVPILDAFVEQHPEFSLNGAKGTIALTGYEGVLGYRTNRQSPTKEEEKQQVLKVVDRLKQTGWNFASHSYGHPNMQTASYSRLVDDSDKWENEVQSIIGPTQVYIYPYGAHIPEGDAKLAYLQSKGFKIFCGVGSSSYEKISKDTNIVITDRRHLDGVSLRNQRDKFLDLYDANEIIDLSARPKR